MANHIEGTRGSIDNLYNKANLFIFDLDGTLYEDTDHFAYYATQLMQQLIDHLQTEFIKEYEKIESGDHIVTIGKVYDVARDHVLKLSASNSKVIKAWSWEGTELTLSERQNFYPDPITLDFDSMIAIGDGWWLPNVCAKHFGVVNTYSSYVKTKDFMATDQFQLTKISGLREALLNLKTKKEIVLVTNSQKDDVQRLLRLLDLQGIFDDMVTEAHKPQYTEKHFLNLIQKYNIPPEKAVSIGDNYLNEIAPAIYLGMQTIFIDPYNLDYPEYTGKKVKSISDIINDMNN